MFTTKTPSILAKTRLKKGLILSGLIFVFLGFFLLLFSKNALAQGPTCRSWCTLADCGDYQCSGCSFCPGVPPSTAGPVPPAPSKIRNPALNQSLQAMTGSQFFGKLLPALIGLGFVIGAVVFVFMLLTGAIRWMTAGGDKAALESARSKIINALVGIFILFSLYAIVKFIQYFFGVSLLYLNLGALKISWRLPLDKRLINLS